MWIFIPILYFLFHTPMSNSIADEIDQSLINTISEKPHLLKVEELPGAFRQIYKTWDGLDTLGKKKLLEERFQNEKYWGYFFSTWGKYYFYTENRRVLRIMKEAIALLGDEFQEEGIIQTADERKAGHWYRETFARNMRLLLEAYSYSKEPMVLELIEQQSDLWIKKNSRVLNNGFKIYPYSSQLTNVRSKEINVNQNLQMGLVFSKLYFLPESKFFLHPDIKSMALDEIKASLSLINSDGFIPLNQHALKVGDSNYAGLSTSILYELVQIWGDPDWIAALKKSGQWLEKVFDEKRPWNSKADGEDFHFNQFSAFNLFSRIPAFYAAGIPSKRAQSWMKFIESKFPEFNILDLVPRWDHLQSLPESYYSTTNRPHILKVLPPSLYVDPIKNQLNVSIVASEVSEIRIARQKISSFTGLQSFNRHFKKGDQILVKDQQGQESIWDIPQSWLGKKWVINLQVFDYKHPIKDK
jgi:hypothetical protein